jgi:hypothetical protein
MTSWKPEVVADRGGAWAGNALRFHTRAEADAYVRDLANRWTAVTGWRSVPSDDPVTHAWENGRAVPIKA